MNYWASRVIADLCEQKRAGVKDFGKAWSKATGKNPAKGRDLGDERPTLFLVDGIGEVEERAENMHDFIYRVCSDAWEGRNPALAALSVDLLDGIGNTGESRAA